MIVLGLHFGHDASVSVVRDGIVLNCIESERFTRAKHAIGLTAREVGLALADADVAVADIDYCSVTSTQRLEYLFEDPARLSFTVDLAAPHAKYCTSGIDADTLSQKSPKYLGEILAQGRFHPYLKRLPESFLNNFQALESVGAIEDFLIPDKWLKPRTLTETADIDLSDVLSDENRFGMQVPVTVQVEGRAIPGFMMSHQFAHAAYAFFASDFDAAAIMTHDGSDPGTSYWGGMYYYGEGTNLYSVAPHFLSAGNLYERIAFLLNLGYDTGAGKLMGLAPWGKPRFYDPAFVGNWFDGLQAPIVEPGEKAAAAIPDWITDERHPLLYRWLCHCLNQAETEGYDFDPLGDTDRILEPINADLAASTQHLIEEILLRAAESHAVLQDRLGRPTPNLCLSGGVALNCPANSVLSNKSPFEHLFVPPAVSDRGLSIGGALAVTHNIFAVPRPKRKLDARECAYLGPARSNEEVQAALTRFADDIIATELTEYCDVAAKMLAENKVIAWYDGRSETGPRALGHRSILAHPGHDENWRRVNAIKGREHWRPFAPAVLEEDAGEWFEECPIPSPFMLFTARVKNDRLPAITHVDGSSRIQTVSESEGAYFHVISAFKTLTGLPVVMNTSLNGPGEPIVETPDEALLLFLNTDLDALFFPGVMVVAS
ncbi:carbamoyltransferase [bacterium SCSIO 12827]|nr:carbamoyltransferase [bacterium SCSIO 12827]